MMKSKYLTVKLNDNKFYKLHYMDWGEDNKNTLVCVHGLTRNSRDFDFIAKELSLKHDYRVISIDMPGRGRSEYLPDPNMYVYENYKLATLSLLDQLSLTKIDYLGSSMGGVLAMHISEERPNLFNKLIFNDVGKFIPLKSLARIARYVLIYPVFESLNKAKEHLKIKMAHFGINLEENWDYVTKHSTHIDNEGKLLLDYDINVVNWMIGMNEENAPDIDLKELWDKVSFNKLLLLRGKKSDLFLHSTAIEMMNDKENVDFIEFDDCGHTPSLIEEKHLRPVVNWLVK